MPRKRKDIRSYSEDDVLNAIAQIQNKSMTYRQAHERFKIPISTLCDKIKERTPLVPCKTGKYYF